MLIPAKTDATFLPGGHSKRERSWKVVLSFLNAA